MTLTDEHPRMTGMRFESRVFRLGKDVEHPERNQDAYRIDAGRGIAAIADGTTTGIFSRPWARILTEAAVADTPQPGDEKAFAGWLAAQRETWTSQIDVSNLAWFQRPKLREGAFSTLLWIRLSPCDEDDRKPQPNWRLHCCAVGDSCLFHVRQGKVLQTFPLQTAEQLEADPVVIGSMNLNRDQFLEFASIDESCRPGDLLVLCTDAVAEWWLRAHESGNPPAWEDFWDMSHERWKEEIIALRHAGQMRYDDATMVLLRVTDGTTVAEPSDAVSLTPESTGAGTQTGPPPLGDAGELADWKETLKTLSKQLAEQVSQQASHGVQKLKEVKHSAESMIRKYREKFRSDDE